MSEFGVHKKNITTCLEVILKCMNRQSETRVENKHQSATIYAQAI
jgi:hypothetical protein